jgi:hypothetical protein
MRMITGTAIFIAWNVGPSKRYLLDYLSWTFALILILS